MLPHIILLEPVQECMVSGLLCGTAIGFLFGWRWAPLFFVGHVTLWSVFDYILLIAMQVCGKLQKFCFLKTL